MHGAYEHFSAFHRNKFKWKRQRRIICMNFDWRCLQIRGCITKRTKQMRRKRNFRCAMFILHMSNSSKAWTRFLLSLYERNQNDCLRFFIDIAFLGPKQCCNVKYQTIIQWFVLIVSFKLRCYLIYFDSSIERGDSLHSFTKLWCWHFGLQKNARRLETPFFVSNTRELLLYLDGVNPIL